jgi:hypothetical protein
LTRSLKATGFEPLPFECKSWFKNVPFTFNLRRYIVRLAATLEERFKEAERKLQRAQSLVGGCTS